MTKQDIFSKIQIVDYNNVLEKVLEAKDFSEDVKNLLLSMLYKIENGYEDYETIKVNTTSKKNFLKKIIKIIEEKCEKIEIVKPMSFQSVDLEKQNVNYIVDKEKKSIKVYQNERMMLEALITIDQKEIEISDKYEMFEDAIKDILYKGNIMSNSEIIRDFNGWSWDITTSQLESKNINIVYQNLLILLGNSFMQKWITDNSEEQENVDIPNNEILRSKYNDSFGMTKEDMIEESKIDYIEVLKNILTEKCGKENAEEFVNQLLKTITVIESNINDKQKEIIVDKQTKIKNELDGMQNNKKYLEDLSTRKKEITIKIGQIDAFLSNDKLLKEEYIQRNAKLANEDKIFSISHLAIMLEKERDAYLKEIKKINKKMEPKEFVKNKEELQERYDFFANMSIEENETADEGKQIEKLQVVFLKCLQEIIKKEEDREQFKKLIYVLRYYKYIPFKASNLGSIEIVKEQLDEIQKQIIKKAVESKIVVTFSENEQLNYNILKNMFKSKIANLGNIIYILKYHKGILKIEIYDDNIQEDCVEIEITEKVELNTKLNKKVKIFE